MALNATLPVLATNQFSLANFPLTKEAWCAYFGPLFAEYCLSTRNTYQVRARTMTVLPQVRARKMTVLPHALHTLVANHRVK